MTSKAVGMAEASGSVTAEEVASGTADAAALAPAAAEVMEYGSESEYEMDTDSEQDSEMEEQSGTALVAAPGASERVVVSSNDGVEFVLSMVVALQMQLIKDQIEAGCDTSVAIPLTNVEGRILRKVVKYCRKHAEPVPEGDPEDEPVKEYWKQMKEWDEKFMDIKNHKVYDIILAANYLEVKGLLDLGCEKIASQMRGKEPEEIREIFEIENDYTPEEEAEIRKTYAWAFEK